MIHFTGEIDSRFSHLLRKRRLERCLSIEEVADALRVTPQTVQRWENGGSGRCHNFLIQPLRAFLERWVLPLPRRFSRNDVHYSPQVQGHASLLLLLLKLTKASPPLRRKLLEGVRKINDMELSSP